MPQAIKSLTKLHTKNLDEDNMIGEILTEILRLTENTTLFTELAKKRVRSFKESVANLYDAPAKPKFEFPKRYLPMVENNFKTETGSSMWHLYNAFNSVLNHHIDGEKGRGERHWHLTKISTRGLNQ